MFYIIIDYQYPVNKLIDNVYPVNKLKKFKIVAHNLVQYICQQNVYLYFQRRHYNDNWPDISFIDFYFFLYCYTKCTRILGKCTKFHV